MRYYKIIFKDGMDVEITAKDLFDAWRVAFETEGYLPDDVDRIEEIL